MGGGEKGSFLFPRSEIGNDFVPSSRKRAQKRSLEAPKRPEMGHAIGEFPGSCPRLPVG